MNGAPTIAYAGMTHLGLNSAVAAAARGMQVTCFDRDEAVITGLKAGTTAIEEPDLTALMAKHMDRLRYTANREALEGCDLVIIAPDIPTDDAANSDLTALQNLVQLLDAALPAAMPFIILSQLPPGFSRALILQEGRPYYYQVETLIFGQAIDRALNPERIIIGCKDPSAPLHKAYRAFLDMFDCPLLPMRYESAELAKIAINCCLVSSISTANTLAELCENIGADWSEIVPALRLDRRIGQYAYLSPGLGIAGGNLERDLNTVVRFAGQHGTDAGVVKAWQKNSQYRRDWVLRLLHDQLFPLVPNPKIAIWGLAYKQDTHSVKNSPSLALLAHLGGFDLAAYDPVVANSAVPTMQLAPQPDALSAIKGADILIIMTPWDVFRAVAPAAIKAAMAGSIIVDPYGVLCTNDCTKNALQHFTLGRKTPQTIG